MSRIPDFVLEQIRVLEHELAEGEVLGPSPNHAYMSVCEKWMKVHGAYVCFIPREIHLRSKKPARR